MKKVLTAAAIISVLSFAGIQTVSAHGGYNNNYSYCGSYEAYDNANTEKEIETLEKFRTETSSIRKEIVVKRSELNALLRNDNPDEKKVAKLTGDLYDLEAELQAKAEETGTRSRYAYDYPHHMRGYGWGYGHHMMGW
jgi:hypothetical protein